VSTSGDKTIRLWNIVSGAALQSFEVDAVIHSILVSAEETCLKTDRGTLVHFKYS
jgi:hypothetical protein